MGNFRGPLILTDSTISGNSAGRRWRGAVTNLGFRSRRDPSAPLTLTRTLLVGNTAPEGPELSNSGTVTADAFNLFGVDGVAGVTGFTPGPTDLVPAAGVQLPAILDPVLADNGGSTLTHALVPGSPAIDAVQTDCGPPATDQRGVPRPQGAACDIGALEVALCGGQVATRVGTPGDDVLVGTPGDDVLMGLAGNDRLRGGAGMTSSVGATAMTGCLAMRARTACLGKGAMTCCGAGQGTMSWWAGQGTMCWRGARAPTPVGGARARIRSFPTPVSASVACRKCCATNIS